MAWQPTTRLHISGYRFLMRRIECALLGQDLHAANEPIRAPAQALVAGLALAVILLAGCAVLAVVRPQPALTDAPIIMGKRTGALYVRLGDTMHPVPNLASARLITHTNVDPEPTPESAFARNKRGPTLGIAGAPQFLGTPLAPDESRWAVCDSRDPAPVNTTVVIGRTEGPRSRVIPREQALLVKAASGGPTYLLYYGHRAVVNLDEAAVVRALGLEGQVPLPVSPVLLAAVPEAPPITAPSIPDAGSRGPAGMPGFSVGSVLRITRAGGDEYYVVLRDGVQRVGELAADLLRRNNSQGTRTIISVAPDLIRGAPTVTRLPLSTLPDRAPTAVNVGGGMLCVRWTPTTSGSAEISFLVGGPPVPAGQQSVSLAQADGDGPGVDAVYVPPGRSAYVRATSLSGDNVAAGTRYLITDTGVRFAVHDDDAAHDLGLPDTMIPAPWPVLAKLPAGPELSRANASVAQDIPVLVGRPR